MSLNGNWGALAETPASELDQWTQALDLGLRTPAPAVGPVSALGRTGEGNWTVALTLAMELGVGRRGQRKLLVA